MRFALDASAGGGGSTLALTPCNEALPWPVGFANVPLLLAEEGLVRLEGGASRTSLYCARLPRRPSTMTWESRGTAADPAFFALRLLFTSDASAVNTEELLERVDAIAIATAEFRVCLKSGCCF